MKRTFALIAVAMLCLLALAGPGRAETAHKLLEQNRVTMSYDLSVIPELLRSNANIFFVDNEAANPSVLTPLTGGASNGATNWEVNWYCPVGSIEQTMSADPGGAAGDHITWYMVWRPLATGVTVTPQ